MKRGRWSKSRHNYARQRRPLTNILVISSGMMMMIALTSSIFQKTGMATALLSASSSSCRRISKRSAIGRFGTERYITRRIYSSTTPFLSTKNDNENTDDNAAGSIGAVDGTATEGDGGFIATASNWREHPSLPETFDLPSITVPSRHVHALLSSNGGGGDGGSSVDISRFLASHNVDRFLNVHPRIKLVRDLPKGYDDDGGRKAILLDPDTVFVSGTRPPSSDGVVQRHENEKDYEDLLRCHLTGVDDGAVLSHLASLDVLPGPDISITLDYKRQTVGRILSKLLPKEALPAPTAYEQNGHVIHMNLKSQHLPYRHLIGSILLDRLSPNVQTVVNKIGQVSGKYRTFDMEVLAGNPSTVITLHEAGIRLTFDLRKVYWCTRLSGERIRILDEIRGGQIVADAFCGVGALCVLAATKVQGGCTVLANDWNPDAVKYCRENAKANGVFRRNNAGTQPDVEESSAGEEEEDSGGNIFRVTCGDAYDFIQNLGDNMPSLPHHLLMNHPADSASFLGALRWWPSHRLAEEDVVPIVHLYIFARDDDNDDDDVDEKMNQKINRDDNHAQDTNQTLLRNATEVAIDIVADNLLPEGGAIEKSRGREKSLNALGCNVRAREVRDVAPGKSVIYVSFQVTENLIRSMQGDFVDVEF